MHAVAWFQGDQEPLCRQNIIGVRNGRFGLLFLLWA